MQMVMRGTWPGGRAQSPPWLNRCSILTALLFGRAPSKKASGLLRAEEAGLPLLVGAWRVSEGGIKRGRVRGKDTVGWVECAINWTKNSPDQLAKSLWLIWQLPVPALPMQGDDPLRSRKRRLQIGSSQPKGLRRFPFTSGVCPV